jgi:hypothetical protein
MQIHSLLIYQHRAGVGPYTSSYDLAESCVFVKQSLLPLFCGGILIYIYGLDIFIKFCNIRIIRVLKKNITDYIAPLFFPKLQSYFAEFLQHNSPIRLNLFN